MCWLIFWIAICVGADVRASGRAERTNLLVFKATANTSKPVKTTNDWEARRSSIVAAFQQLTGPFPEKSKRGPVDLQIMEEKDCGDYTLRRIDYSAEPGARVPAYLLVPKAVLTQRNGSEGASPYHTRNKWPAVLSLHSTQPNAEKATAGVTPYAGNEHGVELVKRGYVVLAPPYPLLGDYYPDLKNLGYVSGTMKAIWDNVRALDVLESLPFVRTNGFGAIGHSLGGHNAIYTAVFDPRIKVVVSSCGFDSYVDYMNGDIKGWTSERYMPRLLQYKDRLTEVPVDFYELIAALAPRRCFINAPKGDTNFKWHSVASIVHAARPVFALYGAAGHLHLEQPNCGHEFPEAMRKAAYEMVDAELKGP